MHRARPKECIRRLAFRAEQPAFVGEPLAIRGRAGTGGLDLWVESAGRRVSKMRVDCA